MSLNSKLIIIFQSISISVKEYGLRNTILSMYEDFFNKHKKIFLSAVDFMIPLNGVVTAGQFIIISRLLDYERIIDGQEAIWDKKFSELEKKNVIWTASDANYFKKLVDSLNTWGWDYNLSSVFINRNPLFAYNGTHRLAYALIQNPYQVVPFIVYRNGWKWSGKDGLSYWQAKGMSMEDLDILKNRLELLLSNVDRSLYIVFMKKDFNQIIKDERLIVTEKVDAKIVKNIGPNFGINKRLHALFQKYKNTELVILKCLLNKQIMVFKNHGISSIPIEEYIEKYDNKALYYTPTITESNEFKILLDSLCVLN